MAANKASELTVKVNVDVSEALAGLKALQREAKKAAQAIRELERHAPEEIIDQEAYMEYLYRTRK